MTRLLQVFAAGLLLPCSVGLAVRPPNTSSTGTLILFIPTKDGLVVGADSRSNINLGTAIPTHCDTAVKIIPLKNYDRAVITVAGTDRSYPLPSGSLPDPCTYLRSAVPILDMPAIVSNYLDAKNVEITKVVFGELQAHVLSKIRAVQIKRPNTLFNDEDGNFATVAFGHYMPQRKSSQVAIFTVRILPQNDVAIVESSWNGYPLSANWEVKAIGNGAGLLQELIGNQSPGMPMDYLADYSHFKRGSSKVGDVGGDVGAKIAINLIEAAKILSERNEGPHTVGGPARIVLLDTEHPAPLHLQ